MCGFPTQKGSSREKSKMAKTCRVDGCDKTHFGKGWCQAHYMRWYRTGNPLPRTREQVFWSMVDKSGDCWIWTGSRRNERYGGFQDGAKTKQAHRYSYEITKGAIPEGQHVDHICFNYMCVNPSHLQAVTPRENSENLRGATRANNSSGFRGVTWSKARGKWVVQVGANGKKINGGYFADIEDAERAAIALRNKLHTNNLVDRGRARGE